MATSFKELRDRYKEDNRFGGFQHLMRWRVKEILLVSSPYDMFMLAEDGKLHEMILSEFLEHNLNYAPGLTRVPRGEDAIEKALDTNRYNLIISTMHLEDMHVLEFARKLRERGIDTPVILLSYDNQVLSNLVEKHDLSDLSRIFIWQGDFRILLTIVKQIEDMKNVEFDTARVGVQVIMLVEDNIRFYSSYLPIIYGELINHTQRLIHEGVNLTQRLLRMRARPKILLANTYEQAMEIYEKYRDNMLGVISDINFPKEGEQNDRAGIQLAQRIREDQPDLPILLQSTSPERADDAYAMNASFIYKHSPTLLHELQRFMINNFSLDDFICRMPDGREVGRARNLKELEQVIATMPEESLLYHAERNHFSTWLKARTEFVLAAKLRPQKVSDYPTVQALREGLGQSLQESRLRRYRGSVIDYNPDDFETRSNIARIGYGSVGGKARGLAFVSSLLNKYHIRNNWNDVRVFIPSSVVLATDVFDQFLEENNLRDFALNTDDDDLIRERFLAAHFPEQIKSDLISYLDGVNYPLAVRSSSILEDSLYQPFAGVYSTYMISNNHPDPAEKLECLLSAVKAVYASTFSSHAKSYIKGTPYRLEEEKMAVIIQRVIGNAHNGHFYPDFSGVARSHNSYPTPPATPEDGFVNAALGLGQMVVDGANTLGFCPRHPKQIMALGRPEEFIKYSQKQFYAIDLKPPVNGEFCLEDMSPKAYDLSVAEKEGILHKVASTYSYDNEAMYDGMSRPGVRLVTFAPILKFNLFPLPDIVNMIMEMGAWGMNSPVEIEFAVNLHPEPGKPKEFSILQMRPLVLSRELSELEVGDYEESDLVCRSNKVLGNGLIDDLQDVIVVDAETFDRSKSQDAVLEIAKYNAELTGAGKNYLLIGVGRWGSADPWLGIPVVWDQINGAKAIIEAGFKDFKVEPSQGSHFFQNLTSFGIGYFTINSFQNEGFVDWEWLAKQPAVSSKTFTRHLRFEKPLTVRINGRTNEGIVIKPPTD